MQIKFAHLYNYAHTRTSDTILNHYALSTVLDSLESDSRKCASAQQTKSLLLLLTLQDV